MIYALFSCQCRRQGAALLQTTAHSHSFLHSPRVCSPATLPLPLKVASEVTMAFRKPFQPRVLAFEMTCKRAFSLYSLHFQLEKVHFSQERDWFLSEHAPYAL